ncbi:hypothetical protein K2X33_00175 [bacterium]|nr:hypothetical protein [bacterium]
MNKPILLALAVSVSALGNPFVASSEEKETLRKVGTVAICRSQEFISYDRSKREGIPQSQEGISTSKAEMLNSVARDIAKEQRIRVEFLSSNGTELCTLVSLVKDEAK